MGRSACRQLDRAVCDVASSKAIVSGGADGRLLMGEWAIHLSQVAGRGGRSTLGQSKRITSHRVARARGRDASSQADTQIVRIIGLSLNQIDSPYGR